MGCARSSGGWRAPWKQPFAAAGRDGIATLAAQLVNLRDGGQISAYDYELGMAIATVLCGGDVDAGSLVDEQWLMALERQHFTALLDQPKTQERMTGMMQTGKPVRN